MLAMHIDARFHERAGKAITNFAETMPAERSDLAQQATRDPYLFDFLGTTDGWHEREVEQKLVEHVGKFLLELGQGFAFIGLLLCRNKNEVVAEYALRGYKAPIGVAEWTEAIENSLPEEFQSVLPSVATLEAELSEQAPEA